MDYKQWIHHKQICQIYSEQPVQVYLMQACTSFDTAIINVRYTAITAGLVLGKLNALGLALGSDTGEFWESASSTEIYCSDITVYNNAALY